MTKASDNEFPSVLMAEQGSTPTTPGSGLWRVFTKSDGLYVVDDNGNVTGPLSGAGAPSAGVDGWISVADSWTYDSATTITVPSGAADKYAKGDKIRFKQGGGYKYFYVVTVADTLLTVTGGSDYTVATPAAITDIYYSHVVSPIGFPQWFNYTPSLSGITVGSGTLVARFSLVGMTCNVQILFTYGSGSAVGSGIGFGLPIASGSNKFTPSVVLTDSGTNQIPACPQLSTTALGLYAFNCGSTYALANNTSSTVPFTWATGDEIGIQVTYEIG